MLELRNVSFSVGGAAGDVGILDDISFTLPAGRILVITGPNGGGKSTLARVVMGIEKPTAGSIFWNGQDITQLDITQRAKLGIGYAFQLPAKFKGIKIRKLLALAAGHDMDEMQACAYLSKVGLCAQELYRPRRRRLTFGRGTEAGGDCHTAGPQTPACHLRRARSGHRPVELLHAGGNL